MAGDTISSDQPGPIAVLPPERGPSVAGTKATAFFAAVILVATAGVATAVFRSTTSDRNPATAVPANAFAVATLHLDLPGGQESAVDHILSLFPAAHLPSGGSLKDRVMRVLTQHSDPPVNYDKDIKPWLGDTATFAGWLNDGHPTLEVVLQSTDDAAARQHLPATLSSDEHFAVHNGWVVLGNTQSEVDAAIQAADASSLGDSGTYDGDINALPNDEAATAWVDGPATQKMLQGLFGNGSAGMSAFGGMMLGSTGLGDVLKGRFAVGLHATNDFVQFDVRSVGTKQYASAPASMLTQLPSGTIGAFEIGDPGAVVDGIAPALNLVFGAMNAGVSESCSSGFSIAPSPGMSPAERRRLIQKLEHQQAHCQQQPTAVPTPTNPTDAIQHALGISFPSDVKTILGDRAVVAFGGLELAGLPDVAIRSHPTDLSSAQTLAQTLATHLSSSAGFNLATSSAGDDLVLATSSAYADQVGKAGGLGDVAQVKTALGDLPGSVGVALYVDLSRVWSLVHAPDSIQHLKAIGMWSTSSGDTTTGQVRIVLG